MGVSNLSPFIFRKRPQEKKQVPIYIYAICVKKVSTLVYLLSEHVRLTIFEKFSGLYGLNRYCSLNFFQEKLKPVRLIDTVRLTFFKENLACAYVAKMNIQMIRYLI